jgi:hypothetical protein
MAIIKNKSIKTLSENEVFVFGSNLAGVHGAGAAEYALRHFGAVLGVGEGLMGQSYALPTKRANIYQVCSLGEIFESLLRLRDTAKENSNLVFYLTRIGQGYAKLNEADIIPLIKKAELPNNILPWWIWENTDGEYNA